MFVGVAKKLDAAGKKTGYGHLSIWSPGTKNHMYWSATSVPEGPNRPQEVKARWLSMGNHAADKHDGHGEHFNRCQHGDLTSEPRAWMRPGNANL